MLDILFAAPLTETKEPNVSEDADRLIGLVVDAGISVLLSVAGALVLRCKGVDIEFQL